MLVLWEICIVSFYSRWNFTHSFHVDFYTLIKLTTVTYTSQYETLESEKFFKKLLK
jgi:hypothetical protein